MEVAPSAGPIYNEALGKSIFSFFGFLWFAAGSSILQLLQPLLTLLLPFCADNRTQIVQFSNVD